MFSRQLVKRAMSSTRSLQSQAQGQVRSLSTSWEKIQMKVEGVPEQKATIQAIKDFCDSVEKDHAKWSKPVDEIDWEKYKSTISVPEFVDFMKSRYESVDLDKISVNWDNEEGKKIKSDMEDMAAKKLQMLADAEATKVTAAKEIAELSAKLEKMEATITNKDTLVDEVWEKYPEIKDEVIKEVENHEWFKDVVK